MTVFNKGLRSESPATVQSDASPIARALGALRARRVPYRVQIAIDRLLPRVGLRFRRIRLRGLTVQIRRNSTDERAAWRVIDAREYNPDGTEIKAGDTVIDVGANIGAFTLVAACAAPRVRVLAFEPEHDNWALARRNAELNGFNGVQVFRQAVAGESGSLRLFRGPQDSLHTIVRGRLTKSDSFEEVESVTLAQIMESNGIDRCAFLKLDCEGAEYDILYRTPPAYLARIERMAVKYHAIENKESEVRELVRFLESAGFEIVQLNDHAQHDDGLLRAIRRAG